MEQLKRVDTRIITGSTNLYNPYPVDMEIANAQIRVRKHCRQVHGKTTWQAGNLFGTRRKGWSVAALLFLSWNLAAQQTLQTFSLREYFGVSHPNQVID